MVIALEWVSKITTVALEMVLPAIVGNWLDKRWGTKFLALMGIALGVSLGIWHLLVLTGTGKIKQENRTDSEKKEKD